MNYVRYVHVVHGGDDLSGVLPAFDLRETLSDMFGNINIILYLFHSYSMYAACHTFKNL